MHLLPDVTWSTLTTFGCDHLTITVSLSSHAPPSPRKSRSYTNIRKADWEGFTVESERRFAETLLPTSCSAEEKVFLRILNDAEDTTSPAVMLGITAALSPMLCDPPSRREISDAPMTTSTLPSSCWTWTSSGSFARNRKTSGGPSRSPPTAPKRYWFLLRKLGGKRSSPPLNNSIAFEGKPHSSSKAIAQAFNGQFAACSAQHDRALRRLMRDRHRHH